MKHEHLDPLPEDLRALIALEAKTHAPNEALKEGVLAHVNRAVTLAGPVATAAQTAPAALAAKKLVMVGVGAFVLGGGSGAAAVRYAMTPSTVSTAALATNMPSMQAPVATVPTIASAEATGASSVPVFASSAIAAQPTASNSAPITAQRGDLVREREILDVARAAMARGRPTDAIVAAEEHAKKWPRGYLVEEREVVMIQALVRAGRRDEAERRAAQFRKSFGKSMLIAVVDAALKP